MTARLVFVHGVGGQRRPGEREAWCEALAAGAAAAGHTAAAGALREAAEDAVGWAYYADLFGPPGAQGGAGEADESDAELLIGLLLGVIDEHLAAAGDDEPARRVLHRARAQLQPAGVPQGPGSLGRLALAGATTLLEWGPLRRGGQWASGHLLAGDLAQAARYLNRGEFDGTSTLDQRIRDRVRGCLGTGPVIVVAHSLGSVVAFETLHEFGGEVPLFVTLGSPLTMRTVVWPRLRPQPPAVPEAARRWLNFWDRDDVFTGRPWLDTRVAASRRGVAPVTGRVDSDGAWVHPAAKYLAQPAVAGPVMEALARLPGGAP